MKKYIETALAEFQTTQNVRTKGSLSVALHLSRLAIENGLPLNAGSLTTGGQVVGLGKGRIQKILAEHGITRVLAAEGGRTSRGSVDLMYSYVTLLNELARVTPKDLLEIENWWILRVQDFFTAKPFELHFDASKSLRFLVEDLLSQAFKRQSENPGTTYVGTLLQHLVGAKLAVVIGDKVPIDHHGASVADEPTNRAGDFIITDTVLHVTTAPSVSLVEKCAVNITAGLKPVIITLTPQISNARELLGLNELNDRVEVLGADQFITTNVLERSWLKSEERRVTIIDIIDKYNEIIDATEHDPSLKINS